MTSVAGTHPHLLSHALRLEYLTIGWTMIEGVVAIAAALAAGSVALMGFGIVRVTDAHARNRGDPRIDRRARVVVEGDRASRLAQAGRDPVATGRPARRHSGKPSSSRRARRPARRRSATPCGASAQ